jgi:hypothetical protein
MAAANVFVEAGGVKRQRMAIKKCLVALPAIRCVARVGHTHAVGGVAVRTNNVQGVG